MIKSLSRKTLAGATALGTALVTATASAQEASSIDVSEAVATIEGGMSAVQAIGAAALVIVAAIAIFKMVRRAP